MAQREHKISVTILICDHNETERKLIKTALENAKVSNSLRFVHNGDQMLDYLRQQGEFGGENGKAPTPGLILLDFNMPKQDWRDALTEIHEDEKLREIPVVVFSDSKLDEDGLRECNLGVNSFVSKPVTFLGITDAMKEVNRYWYEIVELAVPRAAKEPWKSTADVKDSWKE